MFYLEHAIVSMRHLTDSTNARFDFTGSRPKAPVFPYLPSSNETHHARYENSAILDEGEAEAAAQQQKACEAAEKDAQAAAVMEGMERIRTAQKKREGGPAGESDENPDLDTRPLVRDDEQNRQHSGRLPAMKSPSQRFGSVVVIGSGIAGLVTATVLSRRFRRIHLIERDALPDGAVHRKGVPQGLHVHVLLRRGLELLNELYSGFSEELVAHGVPEINLTRDLRYYVPAGLCPRFVGSLELLLPSRLLLESLIRRRVRALAEVTVMDQTHLEGFLGDSRRISGVRVRRGGRAGEEEPLHLPADLVVDACGRGSSTPGLLTALGLSPPEEVSIRSLGAYATRWYRLREGTRRDWRAVAVLPKPPDDLRVALVNPVENGGYVLTFYGVPPQGPPSDEEGFLKWADTLRAPEVKEFLAVAEPTSPIFSFHQMGNRLRHYDRLLPAPAGLVVLGDAFCALNPVYGQGMTVAALCAVALGKHLDAWASPAVLTPEFSTGFHRAVARIVQAPWLAATSQDYQIPGTKTQGNPPPFAVRLLNPYLNEFMALTARSEQAFLDFLRMAHMVASPATVFKPGYLLPVTRGLLRQALSR